jgi:hypothetical protein
MPDENIPGMAPTGNPEPDQLRQAEEALGSDLEGRLADVLCRVARGDTSAVSEVYWLQNLVNRTKK